MKKAALSLVLACLILAAIIPVAYAGSEENPEITDPEGDAEIWIWPIPYGFPSGSLQDAVDIIKCWFWGETDEYLCFSMNVKDINSQAAQFCDDVRYAGKFEIGRYTYFADGYTWGAGKLPNMKFVLDKMDTEAWERVGYWEINGTVDTTKSLITFTIPKDKLDYPLVGSKLTRIQSRASLILQLPLVPIGIGADIDDSANSNREYVIEIDTKSPLSIYMKPEIASAEAGKTATVEINVKNSGEGIVKAKLDLSGIDGWNYTFTPAEITIAAHTTNTSKLSIQIPEGVSDSKVQVVIIANSNVGKATAILNLSLAGKKIEQNPENKSGQVGKAPPDGDGNKTPGFECIMSMIGIGTSWYFKIRRNKKR